MTRTQAPQQPDDLSAAATSLADLLEQENRLLEALELAAAAALLPAKQNAAAAFVRAQAHTAACGGLPPTSHAAALAQGARLRTLAAENRRLLERGLAAQGRVIAVIARAARQHPATAPRYGASGTFAGPRRPVPLAISARI
jgi:hypothetical protein